MSLAHLDLPRLARAPEGLYFERKSLLDGPDGRKSPRGRREVRDDVAEYVAAFANAEGGVLLLGVEDDGTVTGNPYPKDVTDEILAVPTRRLLPRLQPGRCANIDGQEVLVFEVESTPGPVMVEGDGYPVRVSDTVVRMPAEKISAWKERGLIESWEAGPSERGVDDLDAALLSRAIDGSMLEGPSTKEYLLHRRLADERGGQLVLRRGAVLLFARAAHRIDHPNAGACLFRVIGTERRAGAQHNVEELPRIEGSLPSVIEGVYARVQSLLRRPRRLRGLRFEEVPEYPTFAWQEAIVNAVAHRDYAEQGRCIEVWLYEDRLEVINPGGLIAPVSLDALRAGERVHASRNPRIVRGLVDLGLMREQGEGLPRMFAEMEVQFLARPELAASANQFAVTLRNTPIITSRDAEWLGSLESEGLNEAQLRALVLARTRGQVSNASLRDATGLDIFAASTALRRLRDQDFLEMRGTGTATTYGLGPKAVAALGDQPEVEAGADRGELAADRGESLADRGELPADRGELPAEIRRMIEALGPRPRKEKLRSVILRLCALRPWKPIDIARTLGLSDVGKLVQRHLGPMCEAGELKRTFPETPTHPEQAYRAAQPDLPRGK